jgi:endoglucanase
MRKLSHLGLALACLLMLAPGLPAQAACIETSHTVPATRLQGLARGFNLAGQLDDANAPLMHPDSLRQLRGRGMTHIRLPVPAEKIMRRFSDDAAIARQLRGVERIANEVMALGYYLSIDLHPGDQFQKLHRDNPAAAMAALKDAWSSLAPIIGRLPSEWVLAELLNEPDIAAERWQLEVRELTTFVRQRLPDTTLIVGPVNWQRADSLPAFQPLDDRNVIYAIHFYDPMAFTHQGHWNPNDPLSSIRQLPFPVRRDDTVVEKLRTGLVAGRHDQALKELDAAIAASSSGDIIAHQLEPALAWQRRYHRPLIVNEFGVLKHHAPKASRIAWIGSVAKFAEANCWGWTHWEFAQGFGLLDERQALDDDVVRALMGR